MFDCATAAFMNRRSRMAKVIAAVPTAAQAAFRRKSRRVMTETFLSFIKSFLDRDVRRCRNQVNHRASPVAHLSLRGRTAEWEIHHVGDVIHNIALGSDGQLAGG